MGIAVDLSTAALDKRVAAPLFTMPAVIAFLCSLRQLLRATKILQLKIVPFGNLVHATVFFSQRIRPK